MSNKTYNTILVILILIIIAGAYIVFTRREYTEDVQVTETPVIKKLEEKTPEPTPVSNAPLPTFTETQEPEKPKPVASVIETSIVQSETVHYTTSGFSPKTITIKRGARVTFINDQEQPMWVAASPYPSHSSYPTFDQRHAVNKDGLYSFTFTETGGFNYQNDRNPAQTGTIIVTD